MPQYDTWELTHDTDAQSIVQILSNLKSEFCSPEKLRAMLRDPNSTFFRMSPSETLNEFLKRLYRCLDDAIFLGNELLDRYLMGIEGVVNKETSARLTALLNTLSLHPSDLEPTHDTLTSDFRIIQKALTTTYWKKPKLILLSLVRIRRFPTSEFQIHL